MSAAAMPMDNAPDMRGPALRLLGGVLAAAVLAAGTVWWWHTAHWPVDVVRIDGTVAHADRERLKAVVARHTRAGFFGMDLGALRRDLTALPWVRDAALRRVWPGTLRVTVREHDAAATWNGRALVSAGGTVFEPARIESGGLPELTGPAGHGPAMLERLRRFRQRLAPLGLGIAGLHQDQRRAWRLELANGVTLRLGREAISARLDRFVAVWPGVLAPEAARVEAVDLRYTNGFAVAWREGAAGDAVREGGA